MTSLLAALAAAQIAAADPASTASPPVAAAPPAAASADALEGVVVTAHPPVVGDLQKGVLNYQPAFFTPVRPGNAMDMVTWLPGFTFEDTRDMRGIEGSTGNVLIDGKPPTSKTDTLAAVLRRIPAAQVDRIDIIVGGAPGIDMHGRALIANVILKSSAVIQRQATLADYYDTHGRNYPYGLISSSEKRGDTVLQGSLEVYRRPYIGSNEGYGTWRRFGGAGAPEFQADTTFLQGGTTVVATGLYQFPFAGGDLKLNAAGRYYHTLEGERDPLTSTTGAYNWERKSLYDQAEFGAHYERAFGRATFETQLLFRPTRYTQAVNDQRPPVPPLFNVHAALDESAIRSVLRYKQDERLNVEAFAEVAYNSEASRSLQTTGGVSTAPPGSDVTVTEKRGETGLTLAWKPNAAFALDATMKVESTDIAAAGDVSLEHSLTYAKPRAVLTWSIDKDTQVRLRGEYEVGQITFGNFITVAEYTSAQLRIGNADIRPQRDWVGEAVMERRFWDGAALTLTLRRLALQDIVDTAPVVTSAGPAGQVANIGDGRETDFVANLTVPLKRFGLTGAIVKGAVTAIHQDVRDPVTGLERPLTGQSLLQGELHYAQDFPQWKVNWGIDAYYQGPWQVYRPFGDQFIGAWPHVNVFVEYRAVKGLALRAEVQNLPGEKVRDVLDVFTGFKGQSPLSYIDEWRESAGPILYLRVRRDF